jgi:hypothetical protein
VSLLGALYKEEKRKERNLFCLLRSKNRLRRKKNPWGRSRVASLLGPTNRLGAATNPTESSVLGYASVLEERSDCSEPIPMKKHLTSQRSDRTFKIWEYQISHGQLLIRSPRAPATSTSPEFLTNVDLICLGLEYMAVPRIFNGLELLEPTSDEIQNIEDLLDRKIASENIKILVSGRKRFPIVASSVSFSENDWDIFESPFQFRSQYRAES